MDAITIDKMSVRGAATKRLRSGASKTYCIECGGQWNSDDDEGWVGCDNCDKWCHLLCTDIDPSLSMEELKNHVLSIV